MSDGRPFAGITVVEFGQFIAVPYCAQLLADGGAHVIKVESLAGDPVRHLAPLAPGETRHFLSRNRGKHSLPLDLRHPSAPRIIAALLERADVALTNFRPGQAREFGLDLASLSPRYPRLIVGSVTAFGNQGPEAKLPGMDLVLQARSGLMAATGRVQQGLPMAGEPPIADYMCAMMLAFGIASALYRRARTGRGGEVDVSLLMAALVLQNNLLVRVQAVDGPAHAAIRGRLTEQRERGAPYTEQAAGMPSARTLAMTSVYYRTFATQDAAIAIACVSPPLQRTLMRVVGLTDEAHARALPDRGAETRHYAALGAQMESVIASRPTAEWQAIFAARGIPASAVKFPIELLDDAQALANSLFHDLAHPTLGPVRVVSAPIELDGAGFRPSPPTAAFGSEACEILAGAGFGAAEIEGFLAEGVTREAFDAGSEASRSESR